MKIRVAEYISKYLVDNNIKQCFMVVGGGAMHLNDALGHEESMNCIFNHHEQACSIGAEGYYKTSGNVAVVCVTSGPGAINALNGVVGAYQDSVPMIVLSGQTKSTLMVRNSGLRLRTLGNQEFDIISTLNNVCKYSETVMNKDNIAYCLEKALYIAKSGRPGPCWLDIPLDIQGAIIDTEKIKHFNSKEYYDDESIPDSEDLIEKKIDILIEKLKKSQRPIIYAGVGIRISNSTNLLLSFSKKFNIPIVTCWDSVDLISNTNELYCGRAGIMGDRAGNFAVQNSDILITIGTRLNIYQVGYDKKTWAREAYVVMNDICNNELKKDTIHVDLPICCDANLLLQKLNKRIVPKLSFDSWKEQCLSWKNNYPVVTKKQKESIGAVNIYNFIDLFSKMIGQNQITVVANGSVSVVGSQAFYVSEGQRFIMNCGLSSMGYDLPAAIGACLAFDRKTIYCLAGDGSIQMNIQELQTIKTNKLPIKIIVINNQGYHQIRQTQTNLFNGRKMIGVGLESEDLDFPNFEKIAYAYDYKYYRIDNNCNIHSVLEKVIEYEDACLCEVICDTKQYFEPKSATRRNMDGTLFSPPLEDLAPFLSREELKSNMYINMVEESL